MKNKLSPYDQGQADYKNGLSLAYCPFEIGKPERKEWQDGWFDASAKDQKEKLKSTKK